MTKKYAEISANPSDDVSQLPNSINKELIIAANNLVNKLQQMYKHPDYINIFHIASLYQNPYNGPSPMTEMLVLKDLLNKLDKQQKISNT